MNHMYNAITSHLGVVSIDKALCSGDFHSLMEVTKVPNFAMLLANDLDSSYEQHTDPGACDSVLKNVESQLLITHAQVTSNFEKKLMMIQSIHVVAVNAFIRGRLLRE